MKRIDKFVTKSFIPPYVMSFFVAEFVLLMQFLWKYIDEILGKGFSFGVLTELIFYFAVTIIPMAIPLTILISSVMVFGDMAEKFELSSLKSAGVSLFRIMLAGIIIACLTACFSLFSANYLKPKANYKFLERFNSIRKQKPALSIEEDIFNKDFSGFVIRVGDKDKDEVTIRDVMIYDHTNKDRSLISIVTAKTGRMYPGNEGNCFVMDLYDGEQFREIKEDTKKKEEKGYPTMKTKFKSWRKIFDMSQFDMDAENLNLSRKKFDLLNGFQLQKAIDSFDIRIENNLKHKINNYTNYISEDIMTDLGYDISVVGSGNKEADAYKKKYGNKTPVRPISKSKNNDKEYQENTSNKIKEKLAAKKTTTKKKKTKPKKPKAKKKNKLTQKIDKDIAAYSSLLETFEKADQKTFLKKSLLRTKEIKAQTTSLISKNDNLKRDKSYHIIRLHQQFSWALICIIFLFIGGPLGSIVRKGGYGYPLLVAIIFFMLFIVFNIMGEKLNKSQSISPYLAAWLPCVILTPFAFYLTYKAIRDESLSGFNFRLPSFLKKKDEAIN